MWGTLYSKLACALKNVTRKTVKSEPIIEHTANEHAHITISRPIYEYAHGKKFRNTPSWIVVHYTACINIGARAMCKVMKSNSSASSHFYVDEYDICQAVPLEYIAWHVGDGKCKQPELYKKIPLTDLKTRKSRDWRYDLSASSHLEWIANGEDFTGNSVSIGVDICVKKSSAKTNKATDPDWYFVDDAIENTAKLIAYLANMYNIPQDHIITHCMATGKLCPRPFVSILQNEDNDSKWYAFKEKIESYRDTGVIAEFE